MSEKTPEHINFIRWLKETEFIPQRPKEAHLLAAIDKKTGKVRHCHCARRTTIPQQRLEAEMPLPKNEVQHRANAN